MSSHIQIVAIITPSPGNVDKVIEALTPLNTYVEANEPGVLKYQLHKQLNIADGKECLVYIETFKDKEALATHRESPPYQALQVKGRDEGLLAAPIDIKILQIVGGFGTRAG